jgi:hypothetical protein
MSNPRAHRNVMAAKVAGVFPHPNMENFSCPICHTSDDRPIVLVPISGTQEGHNCQAEQIHADCVLKSVVYYKERGILAAYTEAL